jgi:uroporphyrinogen-III decarboxylase
MTNRERFRAAMAFEPLDRPCHVEWGFWEETHARWLQEGLPEQVTYPAFAYLSGASDLFRHFDVLRFGYLLPGQYYLPPFPVQVLEEDEHYRLERNERGVLVRTNKANRTIPQFLDYPVKSLPDYEALRERLRPQMELRYPADWPQLARAMREQQHTLVCTHMDGFFAYPRELMGLEGLLYALYDDPGLIRALVRDRLDFYREVYERAIRDTAPDFAFLWEDMCYRGGPLLSPEMFREYLLPAYRELTGFLRGLGVRNIIVDSDGNVTQLLPLWLEGGVTGVLPFEVRAGMDVVKLGEQFPTLQILGGIDKTEVARGPAAIDAELARVLPAMGRRGGYCTALDHWVPPQISLEDYRYFVARVRSYA